MSPQPSNRAQLIEGTLRCLEDLPPERITARAIAAASGANLASITYHFGSKDVLITEAVIEGLDRWLAEVDTRLQAGIAETPAARLRQAHEAIDQTRRDHLGLARTFLAAIAKAQHDDRVRRLLVTGFQRTRRSLAHVLGLGDDPAARDAAGLILAMFDGLLFQTLLDEDLAIEGDRMTAAEATLRTLLPDRSP
ncbi:TetR family transcriptional regulator C-terminal domain-containing protein [Streptosporangiaceae bacterium NEAU-GS5]|nr:TetR family transcriptional regulator C-terminal domain-containing protein [Streptosporangiaceae bacterium NEAU-GS5]